MMKELRKIILVCIDITGSRWYYWLVLHISFFTIFIAVDHFRGREYGHGLWDIMIAAVLFFGSWFRVVKVKSGSQYEVTNPEYVDISKVK